MIYRLGIDAYFDISLMQCQEPIYSHSKKTIKTHQRSLYDTEDKFNLRTMWCEIYSTWVFIVPLYKANEII